MHSEAGAVCSQLEIFQPEGLRAALERVLHENPGDPGGDGSRHLGYVFESSKLTTRRGNVIFQTTGKCYHHVMQNATRLTAVAIVFSNAWKGAGTTVSSRHSGHAATRMP